MSTELCLYTGTIHYMCVRAGYVLNVVCISQLIPIPGCDVMCTLCMVVPNGCFHRIEDGGSKLCKPSSRCRSSHICAGKQLLYASYASLSNPIWKKEETGLHFAFSFQRDSSPLWLAWSHLSVEARNILFNRGIAVESQPCGSRPFTIISTWHGCSAIL